jgi:hypothetical protein
MVRALLDGSKTQTRRMLRFQPEQQANGLWHIGNAGGGIVNIPTEEVGAFAVDYAPWAIGDRLWVRERCANWAEGQVWRRSWLREADLSACATSSVRKKPGQRAAFHMPRKDSRLTLVVTDVRVQRLHDISPDDVTAEGIETAPRSAFDFKTGKYLPGFCLPQGGFSNLPGAHKTAFAQLWDSLHGPDAWAANPWVAAISFRVIHANIDAPEAQAA